MERRLRFRQGLSSLYLPLYDALCAEMPEEWQPYSGLRTIDEQDALWRQGREGGGKRVTDAQGGQSPHNYGCATDWCLWEDGKPIWPGSSDNRWQPYIIICEKLGLHPGSTWGDFPHNELLIACSWKHIDLTRKQNGLRAAQEHIERAVAK